MPTNTKAQKSKGQTPRGFPGSRGSAQASPRRTPFPGRSPKPVAKGPSGLVGRAQASLPGRKPAGKTNAVTRVLAGLSSAKNSAVSRKPSKKGIVGIVVGGLGVAAVAKRRRGGVQDETPGPPPVGPPDVSAAEESLMVPPLRPVETGAAADGPPTPSPVQPGGTDSAEDSPPAG